MSAIRTNEESWIETPGSNFGRGLATPTRGAAEVSVVRQRQLPGGLNPPHTHDREEVMVVLAGAITVTMEEKAHPLAPGDAGITPPRTRHQVENAGTDSAEWLLVSPAGVRFFHANGEEAMPAWSP